MCGGGDNNSQPVQPAPAPAPAAPPPKPADVGDTRRQEEIGQFGAGPGSKTRIRGNDVGNNAPTGGSGLKI